MAPVRSCRPASLMLAGLLLAPTAAYAQSPGSAPPAAAAPPAATSPAAASAAPPSPVTGIRNKLSAGDLLSAESILEVHREKNGEDGAYLTGLSWLARGALLLGDLEKAKHYTDDVRRICAERIVHGGDIGRERDLEIPLGAAIEVEAQRLQRVQGAQRAADFVRAELARLPDVTSLQARLHKRLNLLTLAGQAAPELVAEDAIGPPPSLASLRGHPVVLFIWDPYCGDCRAQAASLARVRARHTAEGVEFVSLMCYSNDAVADSIEKARADSVWTSAYAAVGPMPKLISTASIEAYGGSSTPTFVFIDPRGVVRDYTPTRLTEAEFDRRIESIVR